jgi:fluoroacetyl-CoA thioesterase
MRLANTKEFKMHQATIAELSGLQPERPATTFAPGMALERSFAVQEEDTALYMGGDLPVLATPTLIAWVELVASDLIRGCAGDSFGSVGTRVDVRHTDTAVIGDRIKVAVSVQSAIFQMIRFAVIVTREESNVTLLKGEHDRALVRRPV